MVVLIIYPLDSEQSLLLSQDASTAPTKGELEILMSKNALTHTFKRLRAPSRCRECDNYVYFNGYECETVTIIIVHIYVSVQWRIQGGLGCSNTPLRVQFINYWLPNSTYIHLVQARHEHWVHRTSTEAKYVVTTRVEADSRALAIYILNICARRNVLECSLDSRPSPSPRSIVLRLLTLQSNVAIQLIAHGEGEGEATGMCMHKFS